MDTALPPSLQTPFRALAIAMVPDAATLDENAWREVNASIAEALAKRPPAVRRQLALLIRVLDALPLFRWGRRFHALGAGRRARFLDAMQYSPVPLLRRGVWGLRTLVFLAYYARPDVQTTLGYRATAQGWSAPMISLDADVVIVGSGAGGGTVARALAPLARDGMRILLLEQGPRLDDHEFTGRELEMADALYEDGGGFLTADGTMTLAFGRAYGGSTVVYTGTSLVAPERVIRAWDIPDLTHDDIARRSQIVMDENGVHVLGDDEINENNRLFVTGCARIGLHAEQFPLNLRGCLGSSLCNLGCPNLAKQGTHRVQLPAAEREGVEVVTRAEVLRVEERAVIVRVREKREGEKGRPSEWRTGEYRIGAGTIVLCGGSIGSSALLLRSGYGERLPALGHGFTCHPAHILVAEHDDPITNDVGHPKSYFLDRAAEEGYVLETCMYFPFVTAKNLTGLGESHARLMRAFPRLQMILVLAVDRASDGNRITVDHAGRPVVHCKLTRETIASLVRATRTSARIFFAAGARRVHAPSARPPLLERTDAHRIDALVTERHFKPGTISVSAAHLMGGCAMGRDARDSVTDSWGRVHGIPWLRVADSSLFPDALQINPYVTVMALADRVAEGVREEAGALTPAARG